MGAHASGDGAAWASLEALDVDQPHGLDYRESVHMAKAVRKRIAHEHTTFADTTVGGIHKPGGSSVLGIEDGTATIVADGTLSGHGIVWDNTSRLWCSTAAAGNSTTGDFTLLLINPDKQWAGGDITWSGIHQFDSSAKFVSPIDVSSVSAEGTCDFKNTTDISVANIGGTLTCLSSAYFTNDVSCKADLVVDGTAVFTSEVDVSGNIDVSGVLNLYKHLADTSGYCYIPGGIILQWGKDLTFGSNQVRDITWSVSFPNAAWVASVNHSGDCTNTAGVYYPVLYADLSLDVFTVINPTDQTLTASFVVIGN